MKYLSILAVMFFASVNAQSYNKKDVIKELKSLQKSPESYYNMKQEQQRATEELQSKISESKTKISDLMTELSEKDKAIEELKRENEKLKEAKNNLTSNSSNSNSLGTQNVNSPYRVQIGRFSSYSMNSYLNTPKAIVFSNDGSSNVYEIAGFNNADDAFNMSQELRRLGINGAFVTKYNNNVRDRSFDYMRENPNAMIRYGSNSKNASSAASMSYPKSPTYNQNSYSPPSQNYAMPSNPSSYSAPSTPSAPVSTPPSAQPVIKKSSGNLVIED
jgi:FtsZ-binding cell division protein ZapB